MVQNSSNSSNSEPTAEPSFATSEIMYSGNFGESPTSWRLGERFEEGQQTIVLDENKCQYRLIKTLGKGGFGITYLAQDKNDRFVAIKTFNIDAQNAASFVRLKEGFYDAEVMALSDCRHPHIVSKIGLIHENGLPCLVMEYINGTNVAELVSNKPLSERRALLYIKQIAKALKEVHRQKWLHRDVKPQNIIIRSDKKNAVLIDFGIARQYRPDYSLPLTSFRSDGYTPFEQYRSTEDEQEQGFHSDVHALAATLYFMLTARNPINALERRQNEKDPLKPPKSLNIAISKEVNKAIIKGMERDSKDRPQTIEAWLEMLPDNSWRDPLVIDATITGGIYGLLTSVFANNLNSIPNLIIWFLGMVCFIIFQSFVLSNILQDGLRKQLFFFVLGIAIFPAVKGFAENLLIAALILLVSIILSFLLIWILLDLYPTNLKEREFDGF